MKLKLPVQYYAITAVLLNQLTIHNKNINQLNFALLKELRSELLSVAVKHFNSKPDKKVTKQIPDSCGILFFTSFNGIPIEGFENVVIKEICKQVEQQLYKTGKFNFDKND